MGLSPRVPDVLSRHVGRRRRGAAHRRGLRVEDVAGWAVHPGGPRILDVVRDELGLAEAQLAASRRVLAEHGNCSSATVLLVLAGAGRRRRAGGRDGVRAGTDPLRRPAAARVNDPVPDRGRKALVSVRLVRRVPGGGRPPWNRRAARAGLPRRRPRGGPPRGRRGAGGRPGHHGRRRGRVGRRGAGPGARRPAGRRPPRHAAARRRRRDAVPRRCAPGCPACAAWC